MHLTIDLAGATRDAWLARPEGEGPWPAVLVIHEVWGLNDDIRSIADHIAAHGYLALAPDLIGGGFTCVARAMRDLVRGRGERVDQARAALHWLADHEEVADRRVGVTGFCLGGGYSLLLGTEEVTRAIAPNYGPVPRDPDHLARLCPTVATYGGKDWELGSDPHRLEAALQQSGVDHDMKIYPEAGHSFLNQHKPRLIGGLLPLVGVAYRKDDAEDAWRRIFAFFDTHVRGVPTV